MFLMSMNPPKIPFYIRFLLYFQKAVIGIDWEDNLDGTTTVVVGKRLFGVIYMVDTFTVLTRDALRQGGQDL